MYRNPEGLLIRKLPATINDNGIIRYSKNMTPAQLDALEYNVALPLSREPYYVYETAWVKEGLEYTETVVSAVLNEDAQLNDALAAVEAEYAGKLLTISSAIVTCFANDGEDMETKLAELRADYQRILAARDAAFNALFGEE